MSQDTFIEHKGTKMNNILNGQYTETKSILFHLPMKHFVSIIQVSFSIAVLNEINEQQLMGNSSSSRHFDKQDPAYL